MLVKVPIFHLKVLELIKVPTPQVQESIINLVGLRFRIAQHPMGESTNGEEDSG